MAKSLSEVDGVVALHNQYGKVRSDAPLSAPSDGFVLNWAEDAEGAWPEAVFFQGSREEALAVLASMGEGEVKYETGGHGMWMTSTAAEAPWGSFQFYKQGESIRPFACEAPPMC